MKKRYFYVAGSFIMLLLLGIAYAWSIFVGPLEMEYGWTRTQTSLAFTILISGFSAGCIVTGILAKKTGYRLLAILAAVLVGGGLIVTAFTSDIIILYIAYGICAGTGIGILYNAIVSVVPLWFPEKTGMITGLLLMGYALSTSILSPVCQKLLTVQGPKTTFLVLGILDFAVFLLGSLILRIPDEAELKQLPQNRQQKAAGAICDYTPAEMLKTSKFYLYFTAASFLVMTALGYLNHVAPALQGELNVSATTSALAVSAMSLCNGIARPLTGQFIDRKGVKTAVRIVCLIYTSAAVLGVFALVSHSTVLMIVSACILLFGYGCQGASLPCVARALYGNRYFSLNYSIISLVSLTGSFCPSIVGMMQMKTGSYVYGFMFMMLLCIGSVPLMFLMGRETKKIHSVKPVCLERKRKYLKNS